MLIAVRFDTMSSSMALRVASPSSMINLTCGSAAGCSNKERKCVDEESFQGDISVASSSIFCDFSLPWISYSFWISHLGEEFSEYRASTKISSLLNNKRGKTLGRKNTDPKLESQMHFFDDDFGIFPFWIFTIFLKHISCQKKNTGVLPKNTNPNPVRMHAHSTRAQVSSTRLKPVAHG